MSSPSYDTLIVGAGFAGSVMARQLAEAGQRVLIIDKRDHIGGNAYDYVNKHGVRIHKYGPHIFHTNSEKVFAYLSRFTEWRPYEHRVLASVKGKLVPFPINLTTLEMVFGRSFTAHEAQEFLAQRVARDWHGGEVETAEDQIVSQVGRELFELFFAGYTKKMWGVKARELDKSVTARIPLRLNRDDRYFTDTHQAMPKDGYTAMFERMLDHPNIEIALRHKRYGREAALTGIGGKLPPIQWRALGDQPVIWTGPIDQYFGLCFGPLPYRSMRFDESYKLTLPQEQVAAVTNYPGDEGATRRTRWQVLDGSVGNNGWTGRYLHTTREYPTDEGEPFYPIPAPSNRALYKRYEALADAEPNVTFLGRLGRYQYLNMDQVVGQALMTAERFLGANPAR